MKIATAAGGGLLLGFYWNGSQASVLEGVPTGALAEGEIGFNSYLSISPNNVITIFSPNPELGQNIKTTFPMIVAEELDADWSKVQVLQAALDTEKYDRQVTGGSGAIPHSWERLRKAGAGLVQLEGRRWLRLDNYVGVIEAPDGTRIEILPKTFDEGPANAHLVEAFKERKQDPSGPFVFPSYAAVQVIADGIRLAGSDDPAKVAEALRSNTFDTPTGQLACDEKGDLKDFNFVVYEWHADGSKTALTQ